MKHDAKGKYFLYNARLVIPIIPIVLVMIIVFFSLTRNRIITLSRDRLALKSKNYAQNLSDWTDGILNELNIYKNMTDAMGLSDPQTYKMLETSYGPHEAYPYGLYLGDETGKYFDASGWEPDEDFVVTERTWYVEGLEHDKFTFGEPYVDAMTGQACMSVTVKLQNEALASVLSADVYFEYAQNLVEDILNDEIEEAFFVTGDGRVVVADSNTSMVGAAIYQDKHTDLYGKVNELLDGNETGQSRVKAKDGAYYVDINAIGNTGWFFVTWMSERNVLKDLRRTEIIMTLIALAAIAVLSLLVFRAARQMSANRIKAKTDSLTLLLNRDGYRETVMEAMQNRRGHPVMLFMDMDNFKQVNDKFGHPVGDTVLKQFATLLTDYFNRNTDIVARIGGDEFAVYVGRDMSEDDVKGMLRKFVRIFHEKFDADYSEQQLSVSIGAVFVTEEHTYGDLYQCADNALYEVKRKGKDGFWIDTN